MNRQEFMAAEANMSQLADILNHPVLRTAIEIVRAEGVANLPEPIPGVDFTAQLGAAGSQAVGWARALKALESLSRPPVNPGPASLRFSEQQFSEPAKERMRRAGIYTNEEIEKIK
jgi:hypothetical protein